MSYDSTLYFQPPLPCATWQGTALCLKPATVGTVYRRSDGQFSLLPICADCVKGLVKQYGLKPIEDGNGHM